MTIPMSLARKSALYRFMSRWRRRRLRQTVSQLQDYKCLFAGRRALEVGGPSEMFGNDGQIPIYDVIETVDNCLFATKTLWTGVIDTGKTFKYDPRKENGRQLVCEATDLSCIDNVSYDCVLACHCLEHVANPLAALAEWRRVLKDEGLLLVVLPHKDQTFDWRRQVTPLSHMVSDLKRNTSEEDLTHLPEILAVHDLSRDPAAGTIEQFRVRCLRNAQNRAIHHHVFDAHAVVELVDYAGFQIIRVDLLPPYHIAVLARYSGKANNQQFKTLQAEYLRTSPFYSDRAAYLNDRAACLNDRA